MPRRRSLIRLLLACMLVALALAVRRWLDVVEVRGRSMAPTLLPGDRLLAVRLARPPRRGEIVLAPDPRDASRELIKRVASIDRAGVLLRGDNPRASTDGRAFGHLPSTAVRWRIAMRYWPPDRIGLPAGGPPSASVAAALAEDLPEAFEPLSRPDALPAATASVPRARPRVRS